MTGRAGVLRGRLPAVLVWCVTNLLLAYWAAFPLVTAVTMSAYLQARFLGNQAAPYDGLEATVAAVFVAFGTLLGVGVFVVANRHLRRRMSGWNAAVFWLSACAVQPVPFVLFMAFTDRTFGALFGDLLF